MTLSLLGTAVTHRVVHKVLITGGELEAAGRISPQQINIYIIASQ